jgi:hypothetical protein
MMHNNLFIFNFKKLLALVLTFAVFVGVCKGLDYLFVQPDEFGRITWHSFYAQEENIDNLFVGSSHVYCDIDPYVLDELNGQNNFNLSVGNMRLNNMYYSIREANRYHDLKNVVVEMYYDTLMGSMGDFHSENTVPDAWYSSDYMHLSWNKLAYIWNLSEKEQYLDTIFPFTRFRSYLFDTGFVQSVVASKQTDDYKNYVYHVEDESGTVEFQDKGYGYTTRTLSAESRNIRISTSLDNGEQITDDAEEYLRKIIEYCQKEDIRLTLIVSPIYALQLFSTGDYDAYRTQIAAIADEYDVPFYDFNLVKSEYLDIQQPENFMDTGHLNATGAAAFSTMLWQVLQQEESDNQEFFYDSFQEKMEQETDQAWGVCYYTSEDGSDNVMIIASNKTALSEFSVTAAPYDSDARTILDRDTSNVFTVPVDEHGALQIEIRRIDTGNVQELTIYY